MILSRLAKLGLTFGIFTWGCGSSLEFSGTTDFVVLDAGGETPMAVAPNSDEGVVPAADAGSQDAGGIINPIDSALSPASTEPPPATCPRRQDGLQANVCVRVRLATFDLPSETPPPELADGHGVLVVGLSVLEPTANVSYAAKTFIPAPSTGLTKFAISDVKFPKSKITEALVVPQGKYYVYGVFQEQLPFGRPELALGDWAPREPLAIDVKADSGQIVDLVLYPVRRVVLEVKAKDPPVGNGIGPSLASLSDANGRLMAEYRSPCFSLQPAGTTLELFTNYVGEVSARFSLFDLASPSDKLDALSDGTLVGVTKFTLPSKDWSIKVPVEARLGAMIPPTRPVELDDRSLSCAE